MTRLTPAQLNVIQSARARAKRAKKLRPGVPPKSEWWQRGLCLKCGSRMEERQNRTTGEFFRGCLRWPKCKGTRNVRASDDLWDDTPEPVLAKPVLTEGVAVVTPKSCIECGDPADRLCGACGRRVCADCRSDHTD